MQDIILKAESHIAIIFIGMDEVRVLVTGTGRGGTTLTKEVIKGLNIVDWHPKKVGKQEDRKFFKYKILPQNYGTKLVTPSPISPDQSHLYGKFHRYGNDMFFTIENLIKRMQEYKDLYLIFSFRHPVDTCMSKIVRGQKHSDGGDKTWKEVSPDGTPAGAILAVKLLHKIYQDIKRLYPERVLAVRFENLLLNPEEEVGIIARFLGVTATKKALEFYKYNPSRYQFKRYGANLDKSQVAIHKRWETAYNGFFKDRGKDIRKIKESFMENG